jgi:hypothetical protein
MTPANNKLGRMFVFEEDFSSTIKMHEGGGSSKLNNFPVSVQQ